MGFYRARTKEQISQRRELILKVAQNLYQTQGHMAVTFTNISKETSFTRQAIYKYYQTREEVMLDLLQHYYLKFVRQIEDQLAKQQNMTKESFARILTDASLQYPQMLSLFSILYTIIEEKVAFERLVNFKALIFSSFKLFHSGLKKINPALSEEEMTLFDYYLISLLSSLYPITHPTAKQAEAMASISTDFKTVTLDKLCYTGILHFLG
ncbi:TetR family transcriptional regulator [Streptococcus macacae]|uniref:HTH tetR-type domain-containing protein n=1 Tax=Streptococcus macacae NCTC 11558 TaxID=764298 RepID=G5JXU3_9STRE|nr:TetR family transcriptional regulator [Streptococcus macacae]EHJ52708.1 hypothetical protein STRMA_1733 [Streptococcus macacae NCTC 11558]SUN77650.1 Uncharacterised protein [Streptococcus macacae NCTC 11558]